MSVTSEKEFVLVEDAAEGVLSVAINSPRTLNALNARIIGELRETFRECAARSDVSSVLLTGKGKAFVAGADISELSGLTPGEAAAFSRSGYDLFQIIEEMPQPVVAVINGFALGGGLELALACDFRFVAEGAKLGLPEISLGIIPGFGGTQRLASIVGISKAREMILTGNRFDAAWSLACGLVDRVFPEDRLWDESLSFAGLLAARSGSAMSQAKKVLNLSRNHPVEKGLEIENMAFAACFEHPDSHEGIKAFLEKRKPRFA